MASYIDSNVTSLVFAGGEQHAAEFAGPQIVYLDIDGELTRYEGEELDSNGCA